MKTTIVTILFSVLFINTNAQEIQATTSAGKKVILNVDDKSWRWANESDGEKLCITNHTGNVLIHNNTKQDIYLYYSAYPNSYDYEYVKVKAGAHREIENLYTKRIQQYSDEIFTYKWTVAYELYDNKNGYQKLNKIQGFDSGTFILNDCETKDVKIYD